MSMSEAEKEAPGIDEGDKVTRKSKPSIEEVTKPKLAAIVAVAEKLEQVPVEMKGNKDLKDYAGMNPEAAKVMGWPDKDHAIELDEHQSETVRTKNLVHETVEQEEMKQGETYHDAHLDALKAETTIKTPEQLAEKVEAIRGEKEAWQMTENEYNKYVDSVQDRASRGFSSTGAIGQPGREPTKDSFKAQQELHEKSLGWTHKDQIKQALSEGKPVPPEVLKDYPDLATRGGQEVSRGPHHTAEIESSNLSPATIAAENKVLKELKRVFERAAAKDMPVRIATGHWDKDAARSNTLLSSLSTLFSAAMVAGERFELSISAVWWGPRLTSCPPRVAKSG